MQFTLQGLRAFQVRTERFFDNDPPPANPVPELEIVACGAEPNVTD